MTFVFAHHELDLRRQELRRGGEPVHVEPQAFDLLTFLIRNHGRIVSEAALSSRINAARKAIGDSGNDQIFIRTFHKRGFRFVGEVEEVPDAAGDAKTAPLPDLPRADGAVRPDGAEEATPAPPEPAFDRHKPSIAVLPFENVSEDSDHEYFAYGLTEDVIRLLGRNRWLTVLTRHSAAPFRGAEVDPREIRVALG